MLPICIALKIISTIENISFILYVYYCHLNHLFCQILVVTPMYSSNSKKVKMQPYYYYYYRITRVPVPGVPGILPSRKLIASKRTTPELKINKFVAIFIYVHVHAPSSCCVCQVICRCHHMSIHVCTTRYRWIPWSTYIPVCWSVLSLPLHIVHFTRRNFILLHRLYNILLASGRPSERILSAARVHCTWHSKCSKERVGQWVGLFRTCFRVFHWFGLPCSDLAQNKNRIVVKKPSKKHVHPFCSLCCCCSVQCYFLFLLLPPLS